MSKLTKFVAVGDNHGDMIDVDVAQQFYKFLRWFSKGNDDIEIVHVGDNFDFRSIRRGAGRKEEDESLVADVKAGKEFISRVKPTIFLNGNHDDRLDQIIEGSTNGMLRDYCIDLKQDIYNHLKKNGCKKIYDYHAEDGVHRLGKVAFVHGYTCGVRAVEEHAIHYAEPEGAVIMGHLHSIQQINARKHRGAVGFSGGCLCQKKAMSYAKNRLATSKWGSGWTYGFTQGKDWKVWQAHRVGREFIYSIKGL
jgi:metallophosphoesterase superfamily enzyme